MKFDKIFIATNNRGKQAELTGLLKSLPFQIVTPQELDLHLEVDETGDTYEENARLKAAAFCQASGLLTLADDTGLEVDALGGRPGVHSARYVETPGATDAQRRAKMLRELAGLPRPWTAHFHCTVVIAVPDGKITTFNGDVFGEISAEESGEFGFGYDRLFYIPKMGKTLAACTLEEKNEISHRALAVKQALPYLLKLFSESSKNSKVS